MQDKKSGKQKSSSRLLLAVLLIILAGASCAFFIWRSRLVIENPAVRKYRTSGVLDTSGPFRSDVPEGYSVFLARPASIQVSDDPDFGSAFSIEGKTGINRIENLIPGKTYYYRAVYGGRPSIKHSFRTSGQIRMLSVEGIVNVRDIGGWKTEDGKSIRYGKIFRGSELDGDHGLHVTGNGIRQLKDVGIRTEIDLRNDSETRNAVFPIKDFAEYKKYSITSYMGVAKEKELYRDLFIEVINSINEDKPVYIHCWAGADRTGTVIALIEGSLGVSKEDVIKDYQLTTLSNAGDRRYGKGDEGRKFEQLINYIESGFEGATFGEKCRNYLTGLGISENDLDKFRSNMLDP